MAESPTESETFQEPPMHRPRDTVSLVSGLLFVGIAALFLVGDLTVLRVEARWAAPALLIASGLLGLVASLRRSRRGTDAAPPFAGP